MDSVPPFPNRFPDQLFAMAIAISQRGIDQIDAQIHCTAQSANRFVIGAAHPLFPANSPSAMSYLADLYAGPSENSVFHPEPS